MTDEWRYPLIIITSSTNKSLIAFQSSAYSPYPNPILLFSPNSRKKKWERIKLAFLALKIPTKRYKDTPAECSIFCFSWILDSKMIDPTTSVYTGTLSSLIKWFKQQQQQLHLKEKKIEEKRPKNSQ